MKLTLLIILIILTSAHITTTVRIDRIASSNLEWSATRPQEHGVSTLTVALTLNTATKTMRFKS